MKYEFFVKDAKGRKLEVLQQIPDKGDVFPTVLLVPGFGVDLHEYGLYDDLATALIKNGFQTWRFSFAGTGRSEGNFAETTLEYQVEQLKDIIDAVSNDRFTDKTRIGFLGHAFGASVIIAGLPYDGIQSLLFMSPMAEPYDNIAKMYKRQRGFNPVSVSKMERPNKENTSIGPQFWKSLSHFNLVSQSKKATQPVLIIHGSKNFKVKGYEVEHYFRTISAPKKAHIIEKADHGFTGGSVRKKVSELTAEWFEKTLLDTE